MIQVRDDKEHSQPVGVENRAADSARLNGCESNGGVDTRVKRFDFHGSFLSAPRKNSNSTGRTLESCSDRRVRDRCVSIVSNALLKVIEAAWGLSMLGNKHNMILGVFIKAVALGSQ